MSRRDGGAAKPYFLATFGPIDPLPRIGPLPHEMGKKGVRIDHGGRSSHGEKHVVRIPVTSLA